MQTHQRDQVRVEARSCDKVPCKKNDNFHPCMWVEISQMGVNNHLFQVMVEI